MEVAADLGSDVAAEVHTHFVHEHSFLGHSGTNDRRRVPIVRTSVGAKQVVATRTMLLGAPDGLYTAT